MMTKRHLMAVLLVFCAFVGLGGSWAALMSPGPVAKVHADVDGNCDACHLPFAGIPDEGCLSCHADLGARITSGEGFHADHAKEPCITCHTEHKGETIGLTTTEAHQAFDHATTGFTLQGAHARTGCEECHQGPIGTVEASCDSCHSQKDPHQGALGDSCESCHHPEAWDAGIKTLADHALAMNGGHQGLLCADCHGSGGHLEKDTSCIDCHDDAHGGTTQPCEDCHKVEGWKPAEFDHGPCTCSFAGKHQTAACLDCHPGFKFTDTPTLCSGCHLDERPHDDLGECSRCHTATSFSIDRFDHDKKTRFKIQGAHLEVDCAGCHAEAGTFRGEPTVCEGCHQDAGDRAHGDFGACATCHVVDAWKPSTFDHATTGFPLAGQHGALICKDCHPTKVQGYPE